VTAPGTYPAGPPPPPPAGRPWACRPCCRETRAGNGSCAAGRHATTPHRVGRHGR